MSTQGEKEQYVMKHSNECYTG